MNTLPSLRLIRRLIDHIQSEANPIYHAPYHPPRVRLPNPIFGLLILLVALQIIEMQSRAPLWLYRDPVIAFGAVFTVMAMVLVPSALIGAFAAHAIATEQAAQRWDSLLLTTSADEEVLLVRAATGVRAAWLFVTGMRYVLIAAACLASLASAVSLLMGEFGLIWAIVTLGAGCIGVGFSRTAENALAVEAGSAVGSAPPRLAFSLGAMLGILVRLSVVLLVLVVAGEGVGLLALADALIRDWQVYPEYRALVAVSLRLVVVFLMGEWSLVALSPSLPSLMAALWICLGREWLVGRLAKALFSGAGRR
ncbi:MAG: hypothetical protein OHK0023_00880 [Anaerolineae bacterium]